jgi:hypothetical protein
MTPQERYEDLVDEFTGVDGVTPPTGGSGFGRGALRYRRKIFAMFVRGQLVVKLPAPRVDKLVTDGHGERFDANKGTPRNGSAWIPAPPCPGRRWPVRRWTSRWPRRPADRAALPAFVRYRANAG